MNVVQFGRSRPRSNSDLVSALESALAEAKAGRCWSGLIALRDTRGREHVLPVGLYDDNKDALSTLGFKLQAMAADSGFG